MSWKDIIKNTELDPLDPNDPELDNKIKERMKAFQERQKKIEWMKENMNNYEQHGTPLPTLDNYKPE